MTDDLNEKLDHVRDRVVADAKAKPTPEEIATPDYIEPMLIAALPYTTTGTRDAAATVAWEVSKALTDAGYVIVPKADMQCIVDNLVLALARNDEARKNLDKARAMTTDAGS